MVARVDVEHFGATDAVAAVARRQLGVQQFQSQYSADTARILAYVTLAMLPALVCYALAERQLISGLTSGVSKG